MFELHLVDLSKDMIDYLKDLIINSECKKIFFISANKRPIRFLEQRLDIDYLLKTDFYVFDDFVKEFVLKHTNDSVLYQSNLERYFFMLDVIRSHDNVYKDLGGEDKKVFPWAKRLSSLFSEIDKNLPIDTDTLDLSKNLDNIYIEVLKESDTILSNIKTLYNTYRKQMGNQIYGGELYRRMLELLDNVDLTNYGFIFSGLLYLSKLEIEILKKIASKTKVCFVLYSDNHNRNKYFNCFEAVELTVREIERVVKNVNRVISKEDSFMLPEINFYDSSSCMQEMEELSNRLERDFSEINKANEVAVLLPDESVLRLFLTNIPEKIGDNLNITMGYPFVQTNVYGFLIRFLDVIYRAEIQENGFKIDSDILIKLCDFENLIVHDGFKRELIDIKRCIFRQERKNVVLNGGFLYNLICQFKENVTLEKWRSLFENLLSYLIRSVYDEKDLSFILNANIALLFIDEISAKIEGVKDRYVDIEFLISIIKEIAKDIFIPFEGSPLKGLQVMGMLESRGLKFDTLFILDVNEGILPNYDKVDPLLPEMVKRYLGLPTYKEKELLMRYNFFRAVYSAKKVFLFYRSGEEKGEKYTRSRYIEQLILTKELNEKRRISIPKINTPFVYKKNTELLIENQNTNISHFSPTHLDDYINCPYKFYLRYVKEIKPPQNLSKGFRADIVGTIVHDILKYILSPNTPNNYDNYGSLINEKINMLCSIREGSSSLDNKKEFVVSYLRGLDDINFKMFLEVLKFRLKKFLEKHKEMLSKEEFEIFATEVQIKQGNFMGIIDRIDKLKDNSLRIVDYKTGTYFYPPSTRRLTKVKEYLEAVYQESSQDIDYNDEKIRYIGEKLGTVQLLVYHYLVKNNYEGVYKNIKVAYYIFSKIEGELKEIALPDGYEIILEYIVNHIKNSKYIYPLPSKNCVYCDYESMCRFSIA